MLQTKERCSSRWINFKLKKGGALAWLSARHSFFSVFLGRVYKKKNEKDFFLVFGVGVDGFEPPTLCL